MAEQNKSNLWLIIGAIIVVLAVIYWYMSGSTEPTAPADNGAVTTPAPASTDGAVSVEPAAPATTTPAPAEPAPAAPATPAEPAAPATPAPAGTTPPAN